MLSYIVGLIAAFVFLVNPISQLLFGSQHATGPSPRPHLNESMLAIDHPNDPIPQCPPDTYRAQILRVSPLVVYLENFLNEDERKHLLDISPSEPLFAPSTITHDSQTTQRDLALRDSEDGARWCKFIECDDERAKEKSSEEGGPDEPKGTVFKVAPGNAVYWENFSPEGLGYDTTWHAGLPVKKGVKVGLNIWSFGRIE
uniref:Prolyl 4-hydroxylase alpha subunit domain-containing protein n=1 Tax=Bionectria ochroleuca TaxID=29856 RepID=A0A0B7JTK2_BIOOC